MTKVVLMVVIIFNDHPSVTYRSPTKGIDDCYTRAIELSKKSPPEDEHIVKYMIGCSFEEFVEVPI